MNILSEIRRRFEPAVALLAPHDSGTERAALLDLIRPSQDARFGDYQANLAMPLGKRQSRTPREVAAEVIAQLQIDDLCLPAEIAGPGFINLTLRDDWLAAQLSAAVADGRLGIAPVARPRTFIVDYSAPNVAKPMHVGHIRSTVIGDSLYRTLKFLGHRAIGDNHLGDWGTQFGMIIYGYKHFLRQASYDNPLFRLPELTRLYRLVHQLIDYREARRRLPQVEEQLAAASRALDQLRAAPKAADPKVEKKAAQALRRAENDVSQARDDLAALSAKLATVDTDPELSRLAAEHPDIEAAVLAETAKLHAGDAENLRLWREFMPDCLADIENIYRQLGVAFDETLGESFYHDKLAAVVDDLVRKGLARESDGATCVFIDDNPVPMIVRKKDGAFLYATTDLATIQHRMERWKWDASRPKPDAMLYVVDHRQSLHFEQLFATARRWGYGDVEFQHVSFGTVLGDDGRPYKTRSGDTVGLQGLLDEAVQRALAIVTANNAEQPADQRLSEAQLLITAQVVGIGALKYADLSQNRTSDYVFSYDKMLAMNGNTATYMQYAYARVRSIFRRGGVDAEALRRSGAAISLGTPAERSLAIELLRFAEALDAVVADYRPNHLTSYLFELANRYSSFFDQCPVLKADSDQVRTSRLLLCDLTARTLKQGLELLGIETVEQM